MNKLLKMSTGYLRNLARTIVFSGVVLSFMAFVSASANAQFVKAEGTKIVDENGEEIFFSGINLGNWLLWEGYLMMGDFNYRTHTQFFDSVKAAFGGDIDKALEFEHQWRLNYVDEQAIKELADLGFNSVRVPFHHNMFWNNGSVNDRGFQYIDRLVELCRKYGIYILLDMHAAPGYQNPGDHADNVDSNADQPRDTVYFWDGDNVDIAATIWRHIAQYYKDEPIIWGYDLINEPVPQPGREYELLPSLIKMRDAIRQVDANHIIVAEGSWWSSELDKIDWTDPNVQTQSGVNFRWDDNLVYQTHHYGPANEVFGREDLTNKLNVPIIIGEYGESENGNIRQITDWAQQNTAGYFPWSFKKMSHDRTLWTIPPTAEYERLKSFINNGGTPPANLFEQMIAFAKTNIRNGHSSLVWHQGFFDAVKPTGSAPSLPVDTCGSNYTAIPAKVQAEDYCSQSGVQLEDTADAGGGQNVGYLDAGDYMEFDIQVASAGNYVFEARVASDTGSGAFGVQVGSSTKASFTVVSTGGWQVWKTIQKTLALSAGTQKIRVAVTSGGFNLNWFQIKEPSAPSSTCSNANIQAIPGRIEAESFCQMNGLRTQATSDSGGGSNVGYVHNRDWARYRVNVSEAGEYTFRARVASPNANRRFNVLFGGSTKATITTPNTGGWQVWRTVEATVNLSAGTQILRVNFLSRGQNINWMELEKNSTTTPVEESLTEGTYKIINVATNKALDVAGLSTENGGNVQQWEYGGGVNQQWQLVDRGNGLYEVISVHSGKCLDADSGGTNVQQWECSQNANQLWKILFVGSGRYTLEIPSRNQVAGASNDSRNNGANIVMTTYSRNNSQRWALEKLN